MSVYIIPQEPLHAIADYELWISKYKESHGRAPSKDDEISYMARHSTDHHVMVLLSMYASVRREKILNQHARSN